MPPPANRINQPEIRIYHAEGLFQTARCLHAAYTCQPTPRAATLPLLLRHAPRIRCRRCRAARGEEVLPVNAATGKYRSENVPEERPPDHQRRRTHQRREGARHHNKEKVTRAAGGRRRLLH